MFQHTAARRRLAEPLSFPKAYILFQHTAARRRLGWIIQRRHALIPCFNTQPPEGGWIYQHLFNRECAVSTHSRPKAAGQHTGLCPCRNVCFNTQPPEGGWINSLVAQSRIGSFNTQPPEGGWVEHHINLIQSVVVSTHSRPKAAGFALSHPNGTTFVSTHSRPKAADLTGNDSFYRRKVSTHSRPKAAGTAARRPNGTTESFNTQPPEGGWVRLGRFAHRTLGFNTQPPEGGWLTSVNDKATAQQVSTHSRPKAAGPVAWVWVMPQRGFNTQPPEGGWFLVMMTLKSVTLFQHTAARRRLEYLDITQRTCW